MGEEDYFGRDEPRRVLTPIRCQEETPTGGWVECEGPVRYWDRDANPKPQGTAAWAPEFFCVAHGGIMVAYDLAEVGDEE